MHFLEQAKGLSTTEKIQISISGLGGLLLCVIASAIGNAVLVEISINMVFSAVHVFQDDQYFGMCFIMIGLLLIARVNNLPDNSQLQNKKQWLRWFGIMVLLSGIICFSLERDWNQYLGPKMKVPLYIVLAVSLNFTLIFGFIDTINFLIGLCQHKWQRTLVETPNQIICVLIMSTSLGFVYGLLFSIMDIEDIRNFYRLERKLLTEEYICMPIAAILGIAGGVINEFLRIKQVYMPFTFEPVHDPFTEEI